MKVLLFKYSIPLVYFLSASVVVLLLAVSLLYVQKNKAQTHNRLLILQNDSILSEHIRLKNTTLQKDITYPDKKAVLSSITLSNQEW